MAHPHAHAYQALAHELLATGIVSDPWLDGRERFAVDPIVLAAADAARLAAAAEAVAAAYDEAARLCAADPWLVERYYPALTPFQHLMWSASGGAWHGIARADVFLTDDAAPQICELNCDTPSGEAEAVLLNAAVARRHPSLRDPNVALERAFVNTIGAFAASLPRDPAAPPTVGIIYPTELVEDLSMILLYRRWLEARGCRVVLGSPFNLGRADGRAALFDVPCDVFVRHYKTDWWSEREPARSDDAAIPDAEPLAHQLAVLVDAELAGTAAVVNPFGAVLLQNKRTMALLWEELSRFSPAAQQAIRAHVPFTARLEALPADALARRADWVLKSDYGCEGTEVLLGAEVDEPTWREALACARPGRWIAQRAFRPRRDADGRAVNHGVYVVGGEASGFFSRVHRGATDYGATTAATLIEVQHG